MKKRNTGLLVALLALGGCAYNPTTFDTLIDRSNNEYEKENLGEFTEITKDNYKDILMNKKSGVYAHPFYPNELITFIFHGEEHPPQKLLDVGLGADFYSQRKSIAYRNEIGQMSAAVHVMRTNIRDRDSNLISFNPRLNKHGNIDKHRMYFIAMHEVAHTLYSQAAAWNATKNLTDLENMSEIAGSILTYQLMMEEGHSTEEYIKLHRRMKKYTDVNLVTHRTRHAFDIMDMLIQANPERFRTMPKREIEMFSRDMAYMFASHDYGEASGVQDIRSNDYMQHIDNKQYFVAIIEQLVTEKYSLKIINGEIGTLASREAKNKTDT